MGSTMSLKIPLTLAIIDGIVMETGTSSFVLETGVIKEFFRVKEDMMLGTEWRRVYHDPRRMLSGSSSRQMVWLRGISGVGGKWDYADP